MDITREREKLYNRIRDDIDILTETLDASTLRDEHYKEIDSLKNEIVKSNLTDNERMKLNEQLRSVTSHPRYTPPARPSMMSRLRGMSLFGKKKVGGTRRKKRKRKTRR